MAVVKGSSPQEGVPIAIQFFELIMVETINVYLIVFVDSSSHGSTALVSLGLLYEIPRSHSDTPHSVGLLWMDDRPVEKHKRTGRME